MPMGVVSDSDFERELKRSNPPAELPVIKSPEKGRGDGNVQVPDSLRKIIGETSEIEGRKEALKLAELFDISKSSVSAYANGSHSTATYEQTPNKPHINGAKKRVAIRARKKLTEALNEMTQDKLKSASAPELASVAKAMSGIIKDMDPEPESQDKQVPQFVVYSPQIRDERSYEIVFGKDNF